MKFRRSLLFLLFFSVSASPLRAAFILDDFDDPAQVVSPEMKSEFVETVGVGPLNATRSIRIAVIGNAEPEGQLDSGVTTESVLTGHISRFNPASAISKPIVAVQSNYEFASSDFTEDGENNALFFDFVQLTSEMAPSLFKIFLHDGNDFFLFFESPFPRNADPFTVVVPLDKFAFRDGQLGLPDYTTIQSLNLEIRASTISGGGPDPLNFFVELDRIRVGRIPEPSTIWLLGCALVVLLGRRVGATM